MKIDPIRKKRSEELRQMRLDKGVSQEYVSTISGLSRTTIIRIENGTIGWNIDSEILYFETLKNTVVSKTA